MRVNKGFLLRCLLPAVAIYLFVYAYPTAKTLVMSFFNMKTIATPVSGWTFKGFDNYLHIFTSGTFWASIKNIVRIWILCGAVVMLQAILFATFLTKNDFPGKRFFRIVVYLPHVMSVIALGNMWLQYVFNSKFGLLTKIFTALGLDSLAQIIWTSPEYIFYAMAIAYCYGMTGYFMMIYISGMERIPEDIYESARIDGASQTQAFFKITFPLLKDIHGTVFTLWSIRVVGFFALAKVFTPWTTSYQTVTPMVYAYEAMFGQDFATVEGRVGIAASACVMMSIITVIMFLLSQLLTKGDHYEF